MLGFIVIMVLLLLSFYMVHIYIFVPLAPYSTTVNTVWQASGIHTRRA